jgi:hypothetical protein
LNWIEFIHIPQNPKTGITTGYGTSQAELNINLNFIRSDGSFYWAQSSVSIILDITIKLSTITQDLQGTRRQKLNFGNQI